MNFNSVSFLRHGGTGNPGWATYQLSGESPLLCGRHDYLWGTRWGESGNFFSRLHSVINAEGSLLIQWLYWSFWTFQLQINGSYILSQPPNWHSNTCDIYTYTPQLLHPNCFSSYPLPFLFFSSSQLLFSPWRCYCSSRHSSSSLSP